MRLRFPKTARLSESSEFARLKRDGTSQAGRYLVLSFLRHGEGSPRLGLITTRRVGGAVIRNRIRRRLREAYRATLPQLQEGVWVVLIARHRAAEATFAQLQEEWLRLARRAGILQTP